MAIPMAVRTATHTVCLKLKHYATRVAAKPEASLKISLVPSASNHSAAK